MDLALLFPFIKGQIMMIGIPKTYNDLFQLFDRLQNIQTRTFPSPNSIAKIEMSIDPDQPIFTPSVASFFQALGAPVARLGNHLQLKQKYVLVQKGAVISQDVHKLLCFLNLKPYVITPTVKYMYISYLNKNLIIFKPL